MDQNMKNSFCINKVKFQFFLEKETEWLFFAKIKKKIMKHKLKKSFLLLSSSIPNIDAKLGILFLFHVIYSPENPVNLVKFLPIWKAFEILCL